MAGEGNIERARGEGGRVKEDGELNHRQQQGVRRIIRVKDSLASCSAKGGGG